MCGAVVSNFKLMQLVSSAQSAQFTDSVFENLISMIMLNNLTTSLNSLPGNRVFVYTLMNFLNTFDRLQFYYFHR